jgi:transposase
LLEIGFRPRRVAALLAIDPHVVYSWQQRFKAEGLLGLSTRPREHTSISTRVPVQVIMEVFQLPDSNPLLGHYRVKMALDSLGYRYGHTSVWQLVALYKEAHPSAPQHRRPLNPDERPQHATAPHQVWFVDVRYLVKIAGHGSIVFSYSTGTVGRLSARAVSIARTSPAWCRSAAKPSPDGVPLT